MTAWTKTELEEFSHEAITGEEMEDIPRAGGMLFFSDHGTAGCGSCGWSGVPTVVGGTPSTFCPVCESEDEVMEKVGRNEPCPCGSGRKSKRCHGRNG